MNDEQSIRKFLRPYVCKDVEGIIMGYLMGKCKCCEDTILTDNLYEAKSVDGETFNICQKCLDSNISHLCNVCNCYCLCAGLFFLTEIPKYNMCQCCINNHLSTLGFWIEE
jgi:hypothetical protein